MNYQLLREIAAVVEFSHRRLRNFQCELLGLYSLSGLRSTRKDASMKTIGPPVTTKYPTLWSSVVVSGDILVNRQGYAVPIGETEWATLRSPMTSAMSVLLGEPTTEQIQHLIGAAWEKNKEANNYYFRKYMAEYLGIAMTFAKHGQDVFVDTPERTTT